MRIANDINASNKKNKLFCVIACTRSNVYARSLRQVNLYKYGHRDVPCGIPLTGYVIKDNIVAVVHGSDTTKR